MEETNEGQCVSRMQRDARQVTGVTVWTSEPTRRPSRNSEVGQVSEDNWVSAQLALVVD